MTHLIQDRDGQVLRLTINRPDVRNALNEALIVSLTEAFARLDHQSGVRVIVLTGAGDKAFCAGADLNPSENTFGGRFARPTTAYSDLLRAAYALPIPIIGRINGHCMAGGMGLLAFCDMAIGASEARFGLPETKVGMFPLQVAALLRSIIPARKFAELCITGEPISAEEAKEIGLLNYVAPFAELDAKVDWLVSRVIDKSPTAIRRGKFALRAIAGMSVEQSIAYMETQIGILPMTEDAKEGMSAFAEKRAPVWTGR